MVELAVGKVTEKSQKAPCFQAGDEWPFPLAIFVAIRQN